MTSLGLQIAQVFAGAVVIQTHLGTLSLSSFIVLAIFQHDFAVVQVAVLFLALSVLIAISYAHRWFRGSDMASDAIADQVRSPLFTAVKTSPQLVMLWKLAPIATAVFGVVVLAVMLICAIFAEHVAPFDPDGMHFGNLLKGMTASYRLGSGHLGRDRCSRLIYGSQVALSVSLGAIGSFGSHWSSTSSAARFATF
ncbi:hypothetical protein [Bradyrhizobium cytisi]|uniref:Oligopeptide transport permease C-like N-terminal domain-containing protein n=1 Tax=Bradyrhizobium cytisi TaxID=515489 RepID=A0A5S4VXV4_9BRAD|nr:hypothetical protein [Bradyrhizobium cytisi]TYL70915.1 hypothetical protein FXB38_40905 [Bradyrhizobium cytisi]